MSMVAPNNVVRFPSGSRLHRCLIRERDFLLAPERAIEVSLTAQAVLACIDGRRTMAEIAGLLAHRYEIAREKIETDACALLSAFIAARIIDIADEAAPFGHAAGDRNAEAIVTKNSTATSPRQDGPVPIALLAELTHRCPLRCPYCSNPLALTRRSGELDLAHWQSVFAQAATLGVLQVHLSGGEPALRGDLPAIVGAARQAGLYTNLVTSGVTLEHGTFSACVDAGLDHVQLSVQSPDARTADRIAGHSGAHSIKRDVAQWVVAAGLPLTLNVVVHRHNLDHVAAAINLAVAWGARRIEIAHTQYHGWAAQNRDALMPTLAQVANATEVVMEKRQRLVGVLAIDYVKPDHFSRYPKACMGGWGRVGINITPNGRVLPCHAAESLPGLAFDSVREKSLKDIWYFGSAFTVFRGDAWMQEPCRSCPRKDIDFGGCRCQAMTLAGDVAATDPACEKSPLHLLRRQSLPASTPQPQFEYRRFVRAAN
jgi:pyrroloquinoline quinone biosynthesis protein E